MTAKIAFVTYETHFAPCGGIAAVMKCLPGYVKTVSGIPTAVITPFHHQIKNTSSLLPSMHCIAEMNVFYKDGKIPVKIYLYEEEIKWYFLLPNDKGFFAGKKHPYQLEKKKLLRDSLFFGTAAAQALDLIDSKSRWTVVMQDWEAATTALALAAKDHDHRLFLTLHNSYDSGGVGKNILSRFGIKHENCTGGKSEASILERALPLTEKPIFTVSGQFALDFIEDTLQARVMAPHLREKLKTRLIGINNGPFINLTVTEALVSKAVSGDFMPLHNWKTAKRKKFAELVRGFDSAGPVWGDYKKLEHDDLPWFFMSGRDDPRQKGYDVASLAIRKFLRQGGQARFLLLPVPGDEDVAGLNFLESLAEEFPENVFVFPFRVENGYMEALQGATYGIMPSFYEPFGMANEFYLNGTVGIGRATGGLLQQIIPLRSISAFSKAVQHRTGLWHTASAQPTGILYRERDGIASETVDWNGINEAKYSITGKGLNRVDQRVRFPLYRAMADELLLSVKEGVVIYREQRKQYYRMLTEGIAYIQRSFSWQRTASEYVRNIEV